MRVAAVACRLACHAGQHGCLQAASLLFSSNGKSGTDNPGNLQGSVMSRWYMYFERHMQRLRHHALS